jgi:hypothetical protein
MGKKPKNSTQMTIMRNAKKKKVSKNPSVRYPTEPEVESLLGTRMPITKKPGS